MSAPAAELRDPHALVEEDLSETGRGAIVLGYIRGRPRPVTNARPRRAAHGSPHRVTGGLGTRMAKKLTRKQIEHLQQRLLRERDRALRSLGQFDELAKESAEQNDSDSYSYSDHMADLGTDAMEREKMLLFASKEGRYL